MTIYCGRSRPESSFGAALAAAQGEDAGDYSGATVSFVCFLYAKRLEHWELFAFTTGQGHHVVQPHALYTFPRKLARRLMEPKLLRWGSRPLVGDTLAQAVTLRTGQEHDLQMHEVESIWCMYRDFHGSFKRMSSMAQVWPSEGQFTARVTGSSLHLTRPLTMPTLQNLLELCVKIGRGEPTFWQIAGESGEDVDELSFACMEHIQPVLNKTVQQELDELLCKTVWRACNGEPVPPLSVAPAQFRDFYRASTFKLRLGRLERHFLYPPSFHELVGWLHHSLGGVELDLFRQKFERARLEYDDQSIPLCKALNGEVPLAQRLYFRADGRWLEVSGDQQIALLRQFHDLVRTGLMSPGTRGHLDKPWMLRADWVAFRAEEMEGLDLDSLTTEKFQFADSSGVVKVPYATRCLAEGLVGRKIKKRLEALSELLGARGDQVLTTDALRELFPEERVAEEVMGLLQTERPILLRDRGCRRVIDREGSIREPKILSLPWSPTDRRRIAQHAQRLAGHASIWTTTPTLTGGLHRYSLVPEDVRKLLYRGVETYTYVAQGPHPSLKEHHDRYRAVGDEEGYNRSYIDEPGFYVLDQVLVENLELCDLLYSGDEGQLILYHVKRQFGQATGAAACQIRSSALRLRTAIATGDKALFQSLYREMTKELRSPFRRRLRERALEMTEEEFVSLFFRPITYVYGFLDDGVTDRNLSDDPDPSAPLTPEQVGRHWAKLQQEGYLDQQGRITSTFLNVTREEFKRDYDVPTYDLLASRRSRFGSVYAKVELCALREELMQRGFGFQVCQISRHGAVSPPRPKLEQLSSSSQLAPPASDSQPDDPSVAEAVSPLLDHMEGGAGAPLPRDPAQLAARFGDSTDPAPFLEAILQHLGRVCSRVTEESAGAHVAMHSQLLECDSFSLTGDSFQCQFRVEKHTLHACIVPLGSSYRYVQRQALTEPPADALFALYERSG